MSEQEWKAIMKRLDESINSMGTSAKPGVREIDTLDVLDEAEKLINNA